MARIWITRNALTTGVIEAEVGGVARICRYHDGRRYAAKDYHTSIESAFARVRDMVGMARRLDRKIHGTGAITEDRYARLDQIDAMLDRGELPMASSARNQRSDRP